MVSVPFVICCPLFNYYPTTHSHLNFHSISTTWCLYPLWSAITSWLETSTTSLRVPGTPGLWSYGLKMLDSVTFRLLFARVKRPRDVVLLTPQVFFSFQRGNQLFIYCGTPLGCILVHWDLFDGQTLKKCRLTLLL